MGGDPGAHQGRTEVLPAFGQWNVHEAGLSGMLPAGQQAVGLSASKPHSAVGQDLARSAATEHGFAVTDDANVSKRQSKNFR